MAVTTSTQFHQMIQSGQLKDLKHSIHHGRIDPKNWREANSKSSLLHLAAASNQVDIIDYLVLESKVNINAQDSAGNTPLHLAVINGHLQATSSILGHRANGSVCNADQDTPLHLAVKQTSTPELTSEFTKCPHVNLFARGGNDVTCLHIIAQNNNLKALEVISDEIISRIKEGSGTTLVPKFLLQNKNGLTAFHVAARVGTHEFLEYLLSKSADYNISSKELLARLSSDGRSLLHYAVEGGRTESVRILLKYGGDPTAVCDCHPPPLHLACSNGKLSILKVMVDMCGKEVLQTCIDQDGGTALHSSTSSACSKSLITYLAGCGVGMNIQDYKGFSALSNAIQLGSVSATEQLLMLGADPLLQDQSGYNCLHRAVMSKRMEVFKKLIDSKDSQAMAVSADNQGNLPIHVALKLGLSEMVIALLDVTSEEFTDSEENNYIHLAAISGEVKTLTHLLTRPYAQRMINESNSTGFTPMHYAALGHSITTVKTLTNYGAVIHKNNDGCTPFMLACSSGNIEAAEVLYNSSKFQRDWVDHDGHTALHLAVKGGNPEVITFCLNKGVAITLNYEHLSFLDLILSGGNTKLAAAAISHSRWEECIDVCCPNKPHPILRIIDQVPDVYGILLDHCFSTCSLDPTHPDYWEEFNFKCLNLRRDLGEEDKKADMKDSQVGEGIEMMDLEEYESVHTQLHTESDATIENATQIQPKAKRGAFRRNKIERERERSLTVVHRLLKLRQEAYLLHPVVKTYIKQKWLGFGIQFQLTIVLIHFLLALFFSIFVVSVPPPPQNLNTSVLLASDNQSDGLEPDYDFISTGSKTLLIITFVLVILNFLVFFLQLYIHSIELVTKPNFSIQIWLNFIASVCILIFLPSVLVKGLSGAFWNAAALGIFFAWFSVGFTLELMSMFNIGVYIAMLQSTILLIVRVLVLLLVFIFGFVFSFYILVGSLTALQYNNIGLSFFTNLHSLVAVTDYLGFADLERNGELRFSILVFFFLVLLIVLLPIVFVNLLIGLAVGDIAAIQKEATISHLSVEVNALASLDKKLLPHRFTKHLSKKFYRSYPNRSSFGSMFAKIFHKTLDSQSSPHNDTFEDNLKSLIKEEFAEQKVHCDNHLNLFEEKLEVLAVDQHQQLEGMKRLEAMVVRLLATQGLQDQ